MTTADARGTASLFDPTRLRIARQAAMFWKKDVAELVGVSAAAISQYEKGSTRPSAKVVAALALALGMPVEFFAADRPLGEAPTTTPHFRSLRATTQQERDRAFVHALLTWELAQTMQRYVRLPALDLPEYLAVRVDEPVARIEEAARQTRLHWDLGSGPIPNVVRLLESRGVISTRLPAHTQRVFAFSCAFPSRPVVVLATERSPRAASRFDTAHELAHLVLHHDEEAGSHAVERQAHAFAAEFLAPSDEIAEQLPRTANWSRLLELKAVWGMSMQALLYRARTLGVMTENTYRRAMTDLSAQGWRKHEPGDDTDAEKPILLRKAVDLLAKRGRTIEDLAKEARLSAAMIALIVGGDDRPAISVL